MQTRRHKVTVAKCWEKNSQTRILNPLRVSFKNEDVFWNIKAERIHRQQKGTAKKILRVRQKEVMPAWNMALHRGRAVEVVST
jgi:hypothetical protein